MWVLNGELAFFFSVLSSMAASTRASKASATPRDGTSPRASDRPKGSKADKSKAAAPKAAAPKAAAPKEAAPKAGKAERASVKDKLERAKENRAKLNDKENAATENAACENGFDPTPRSGFAKLPLESVLAPKDCVNITDMFKSRAAPSDELADLAFLGVTGTTPGGRKWRSRMKEANKGLRPMVMPVVEEADADDLQIQPMPILEEAEVA